MQEPITLLVIADPTGWHLHLLDRLPEPVNLIVGNDPQFLKERAPDADVILNGGPGGKLLREVFPFAKRVRWVHTLSAGVDKILWPELIESPVPLTNARGIYKDSLAEFTIASILFFAKDLRRLIRSQEAGQWDQFDVHFVRGKTLGVIGYGEIGRECGRLAEALGMRVLSARRSTGPEGLRGLLRESDYIVLTAPLTTETRGMIGQDEFNIMKPTAVIINVGRGPLIVESALIAALSEKQIRGAALDVFDQEPLPEGHPFYKLDNVLLSPHAADHTVGWEELALLGFLKNYERFVKGEPLADIVDKKAGY